MIRFEGMCNWEFQNTPINSKRITKEQLNNIKINHILYRKISRPAHAQLHCRYAESALFPIAPIVALTATATETTKKLTQIERIFITPLQDASIQVTIR